MSVLDYGDELRGIVTPLDELATHSCVVTKFIDQPITAHFEENVQFILCRKEKQLNRW